MQHSVTAWCSVVQVPVRDFRGKHISPKFVPGIRQGHYLHGVCLDLAAACQWSQGFQQVFVPNNFFKGRGFFKQSSTVKTKHNEDR